MSTKSRLERIREKVEHLYLHYPDVHVSVTSSNPRIDVQNQPAAIVAVYKNLFRIKVDDGSAKHFHTLTYTDLLTGKVKIREIPLA